MFVVTTIFAIASAGFANRSVGGAFGALLGAWTALVGGVCIRLAVRERPGVAVLALGMGVGYLLLGVGIWALAVF